MKQISISAYCEKNEITESEVKEKIKNGDIEGGVKMGCWYVSVNNTDGIEEAEILKEANKINLRSHTPKELIKLSTLDYLAGKNISELRLISSSSVQSVNLLKSFGAEVRSHLIGGESKSMSDLMDKTREELLRELQSKAYEIKADAVIGVRFTTGEILQHGLELMVYGTAVKVTKTD